MCGMMRFLAETTGIICQYPRFVPKLFNYRKPIALIVDSLSLTFITIAISAQKFKIIPLQRPIGASIKALGFGS